MPTFKIDLEAKAQQIRQHNKAVREKGKGKLKGLSIPDELIEVFVMSEMKWTSAEYRAQPKHVIDKLLFYWHIKGIAD